MNFVENIIIVAILSLGGLLLYKGLTGLQSETFELRNDQWTCVKTEKYSTTIMVGKIPTVQTRSRCVNYIKE